MTVRLSDHCADGRAAQVWDPEDGKTYDCPDGLLTLRPMGSAFIVYGSEGRPEPRPSQELEPVAALAGDWKVEFPTNWYSGGTAVRSVETGLADWTRFREDDLKFFSGTATYRKTVTLPKDLVAGGRLFLDLGTVHEFAE